LIRNAVLGRDAQTESLSLSLVTLTLKRSLRFSHLLRLGRSALEIVIVGVLSTLPGQPLSNDSVQLLLRLRRLEPVGWRTPAAVTAVYRVRIRVHRSSTHTRALTAARRRTTPHTIGEALLDSLLPTHRR